MITKQISAPTRQIRVEDDGSGGLAERAHPTLFYDGGCPLCSREVAHYRSLDQSARVQWVDIHATPRAVDSLGVNYEEALDRLHVRDGAGEIQAGAWAFAAVWDELPYYRWLARVLRTFRLLPALDLAYTRFARWRFRRRGCETGTCTRDNVSACRVRHPSRRPADGVDLIDKDDARRFLFGLLE